MASSYDEKRASSRTYFNNGEKIAAAISGNGAGPFFVDVLNISAGGLQFSQKRQGALAVRPGDYLTLVGLNGLSELQGIAEVKMEVRWVIDQDFLNIVSAGCQFHGISSAHQEKIRRLVEAREKL